MKMMDLWSFKEIWTPLLNGKEDALLMLLAWKHTPMQRIGAALQDRGSNLHRKTPLTVSHYSRITLQRPLWGQRKVAIVEKWAFWGGKGAI